MDRDGFEIGVLVSAVKPSDAALGDLKDGVRYYETIDGGRYPRLQSLTVKDIFSGRRVDFPGAAQQRVGVIPGASVEIGETLRFDFDSPPPDIFKIKPKPIKASLRPKSPAVTKPPTVRPATRRGR